ncbi:YutD-like domain-containing protein [Paenibacillus albus]|uniref:DUF1027 domain-containing protein n=1 Tax=Paenibacillus albus TaxID=2495582 RepID=A0A3Q8X8Q1_9BACL|nr:YutD-like domain-containing protein [Paenibacillus albus]AZN43018.1 DUF1027 domain-containing protein [Paenibacillus albus]
MIHIGGRTYELIHENRNGWNFEAFRERFSEVLERYDYVIGDWGYNQLRLKGFFRDNHPKVTRESAISSMVDYINEYCNFGCAYFVLEKQPGGSKSGEDGEQSDDHDGEDFELAEGALDAYVSASRAVAATAQSSDAPASEHQQVKFMPRAERDLRREQQRNSHRKDSAKDAEKEGGREGRKPFGGKERGGDHGGRQGRNQHERGEKQDRGEKQERGERQDRGERGERQDRGERNQEQRGERNAERGGGGGGNRSERPERNRNKRQHFNNNKAPVAAASEQTNHAPRERGNREHKEQKDHAPKQS